jgi:hypothetical protein
MPSQLVLLAQGVGAPVRFADSPSRIRRRRWYDVDNLKSASPSIDVSVTAIRASVANAEIDDQTGK